jgi:hypothetical protein
MLMKRPEDDVRLTNGEGYMVQEGPYRQHLKDAPEVKEVRLHLFKAANKFIEHRLPVAIVVV